MEDPALLEVNSFRGIDFDKWLALAMKVMSSAFSQLLDLRLIVACVGAQQYACILTVNGEHETADEALRHLMTASVFKQHTQRLIALRLARACK